MNKKFFLIFAFFLLVINAGFGWADGNFLKRRPIEINSTENFTDFQVKLNITYDSDMQPDFDDLRFYASDDTTKLPYWIEEKSDSNWAVVWIKGNWTTNNGTQAYLYYGNASATSESNATEVFEWFIGAEGNTLIDSGYTKRSLLGTSPSTTITADNNKVKWTFTSSGHEALLFTETNTPFQIHMEEADGLDNLGVAFFLSNTQDGYGAWLDWASSEYRYYNFETAGDVSPSPVSGFDRTTSDIDVEVISSSHVKIYDDSVLKLESTASVTKYGDLSGVYASYTASDSVYFEFAYARKYTSTEPSYSIGEEQEAEKGIYYTNAQANNTNPSINDTVKFSAFWITKDGTLDKYIFSWNASGSWVNDTPVGFADTNNSWSNVTKTIDESYEGKVIGWRIYANNSLGKLNMTEDKIVVKATALNVTLVSPDNDSYVSSKTVDFHYIPLFALSLKEAALYTNESGWASVATNSSAVVNNTDNYITYTFGSDGIYTWNIRLKNKNDYTNFSLHNWTVKVDSEAPDVDFYSKDPFDINSTNIKSTGAYIIYNITDEFPINDSSVYLYYKTNNSLNDITRFINGTGLSGYANTSYSSKSGNSYNFTVYRDIYPGSYNLERTVMHSATHYNYSLDKKNEAIKTRFFNISNDRQYNFIAANVMNTTATSKDLRVFYCNSSYSSGKITTSPYCTLIYELEPGAYIYFSGDYSNYRIIPFAINTTTGMIGNVYVTETGYIIFMAGAFADEWKISYADIVTRTDQAQTSQSGGSSWTNLAGTPDVHIHQFSDDDTFWYYACAKDEYGHQNCSDPLFDLINHSILPPTSPYPYKPTEGFYSGNITINYTASISPNNYSISYYNITLVNTSGDYVYTIKGNNGLNLSYIWDSTEVSDGEYAIKVVATDELGQKSYGISENFTIDNTIPEVVFWNRTPANETILPRNYQIIDFNVTEIHNDTIYLQWDYGNGTVVNITPTCSGTGNISCTVNMTSLPEYPNWYRVFANDTAGNVNFTEARVIYVETAVPAFHNFGTDVDANPDYREDQFWNATVTSGYKVSWVLFETNISGTAVNYTIVEDANASSYDAEFSVGYDNWTVGTIYYGRFWANNSVGWGASSIITRIVRELELNITYANGSVYNTNDSLPAVEFNFTGIDISNYSGTYLTNYTDSTTPTLVLKNIGNVNEKIIIYLDQTLPSCQTIWVNNVYNFSTAKNLNTTSLNIFNLTTGESKNLWIWTNLSNCYPYYDEVNLVIEIWEE